MSKPKVVINSEQCKGCELCVSECPSHVLYMGDEFNHLGYAFAVYKGEGCTGCALCYYACPEPGTVIVYKKGALDNDEEK